MNKNLKQIAYASALLVGLAGMSVSCKNYDKDINAIDVRVQKLETAVATLSNAIKNGAVITSVDKTDNGIIVTLSNGKKFQLTNGANGKDGMNGKDGTNGANGKDGMNGKDGKDGKDGKSSIITAEPDGFWYINGEKTNNPWKGVAGQDGTSVYFEPGTGENANKWVKVVVEPGKEPVKTVTKLNVTAEGTLTAAWNKESGTLTIYNAKGAGPEGIVIGGNGDLTNIEYAGNLLYKGIDAFNSMNFYYANEAGLKNENTKNEEAVDTKLPAAVNVLSASSLKFYLNPSNVNIDKYNFRILTTNFRLTRSAKEGYDNVQILSVSNLFDTLRQRNVLNILAKANIIGEKPTSIDLFNLEATPKNDKHDSSTAAIHSHEFALALNSVELSKDLALICPKSCTPMLVTGYNNLPKGETSYAPHAKGTFHIYRSKLGVEDAIATISKKAAWDKNPTDFTKIYDECDAIVDYKGSIDLSKLVEIGYKDKDGNVSTIDSLMLVNLKKEAKLSYKYELVTNYDGTDSEAGNADNQYSKYVTLSPEGVLTPNGKNEAIDKTPIVRVSVMTNGKTVYYSYIKVWISTHPKPNTMLKKTLNGPDQAFNCQTEKYTATIPAETVKSILYNEITAPEATTKGIAAKDFLKLYQIAPAAEKKADNMKDDKDKGKEEKPVIKPNEVTANKITVKDDGSIVVTLTKEEAFNAAPKFTDSLHFSLKNPPRSGGVLNDVYVTVNVKITGVNKSKDLMDSDLIENYWNKTKTESYFNVAVPDDNATDSTKCVFENNLNVPFTTWTEHDNNHTAGQIKLDPNVSKVAYSFDKEIYNHTADYDTLKPNFLVSDDGTTLSCKLGDGTMTEIATIDNKASVGGNIVTLKKNEVSEKLLNTKNFVVYYNIKGYVCGDEKNVFNVTVKGKDFFAVRYIRPINVKDISASHFTDGLDKGAEGTYIRFEDLLAPIDWRGYDFKTNTNYWDYYGTFKINIDKKNIKCNLGGDNVALPVNLKVDTEKSGTKNGVESKYGFLTYFNNGNKVTQDFELYVPVTIKYGWGEITETVTVPVMKTVENGK